MSIVLNRLRLSGRFRHRPQQAPVIMAEPVAAKPSPRKKISKARRRLFALFLLLFLIGFQEVVFRVIFPLPESIRFNRIRFQLLAESDPRFKPLLRRGLVYDKLLFESAPDGWRHTHYLNRFGFRERDFSVVPPAGKKRVVVVGDSVTEGQGAAVGETIPARLGSILGSGTETLNLGVVAATLDKVTQLACESAILLKPETLVVVMYANDMPAPSVPSSANERDLKYLESKFQQDVVNSRSEARLPRLFVLTQRIMTGEPIYSRFFTSTVRYFAPVPDPTNPFGAAAPPMPGLKPEVEAAMRAGQLNPWLAFEPEALPKLIRQDFQTGGSPISHLRLIQLVCRQMNVKLVLAYVPYYGTVNARYAQPLVDLSMPRDVAESLSVDPAYKNQALQLKAICESLKIPFVDTTPALVERENAGQPQFWAYDSHPRPEGYRTIAEAIAKSINP